MSELRSELRFFGNDKGIVDPDTMKKVMLEHMSGLFLSGDSIEDAIPYVAEDMVFSVLFKIRNPFFLWTQEVVGTYNVRTGDIYGFRRGLSEAHLEDVHSSALGLNFMNALPEGFTGAVARSVCEKVSEYPFVFRKHSTAVYEALQADMLNALAYRKTVEESPEEGERLDRLIRRLRQGEFRMVRHRLTYSFLTRSEELYVDFDMIVRDGLDMLYSVRVSTDSSSLGSDAFVVRALDTIEDIEKWIDLPPDRSMKFRQNLIHFKRIMDLPDFLWQRWVSGQSENMASTTRRDYEWL